MSRRNASQEASDWAEKKRQQVEKAKQLREERKQSLQRVAQNDIVGSSAGFSNGYNGGNGMGGYNQGGQQYGYGGKTGYNGGGGNNYMNEISSTPQQLGGKYGYKQDNFGGGGGFSQGDIRQNGYQGNNRGGGPVKAVDLGFDTGYSNQRAGGNKYGGGGYDQYETFNSNSTKTSLQVQNNPSNYRKAFNPNTMDMQSNGSRQSNTYYETPNQHQQQKRSVPVNDRRTISSRENQNRGYEPQEKAPLYGQKGKQNMRTIEEQKYDYQPQKREAPQRNAPQRNAPTQKKGGYSNNNNMGGGYNNYDDEVSKQVIPAVSKKGKNYEANLGPEAFSQPTDMDLQECPSCGRSFNYQAYQKHSKICKKVFQQKRKVFNSQQHRIVSNEQKQLLTQAKRSEQVQPQKQQQMGRGGNQNMPVKGMSNKQKWKAQSEQFRAAMRAARGAPNNGGGGGYGGGSGGYGGGAAAEQYDDRTPCPYCGRRFNDIAAQRHIPHCQNKAKETAMRVGPVRGGRGYRR